MIWFRIRKFDLHEKRFGHDDALNATVDHWFEIKSQNFIYVPIAEVNCRIAELAK